MKDPLSATFKALADPTRRAILARLSTGEVTVNELAEPFAMSLPAVSQHLKVLEGAGLITRGRDENLRCVTVVHGKGYRSGSRGPVLKSAVNTWLRRSHDVVAFTSARSIDGGAGALYVLLRA